MTKFTSDMPSDPNLKTTAAPVAPVQERVTDYSAVNKGLDLVAKAGSQIYTNYKIGELNQDMANLAAEQEDIQKPEYSLEEIQAMSGLQNKLAAYEQYANSTGRIAEFRTRAEALLKEHINAQPALAREFRSATAGILGFDPTGSTIAAREAKIKQDAAQATAMSNAIYAQAQSFGINREDLMTPDGQRRYAMMTDLTRLHTEAKLLNDINEELNPAQGSNLSLAERNQVKNERLFTMLPDLSVHNRVSVNNMLGGVLGQFGLDVTSADQFSPEMFDSMSQENKSAVVSALKNARQQYMDDNRVLANRPGMSPDEWKMYEGQLMGAYDEWISVFSGETTLDSLKQRNEILVEGRKHNLNTDPAMQPILTWSQLGFRLPEGYQAMVADKVLLGKVGQVLDVNNPNPPVLDNVDKQQMRVLASTVLDSVAQLDEASTPEQVEMAMTSVTRMVDGLERSTTRTREGVNEFVRIIADPQRVETMRRAAKEDPSLQGKIESILEGHTKQLSLGMDKKLEKANLTQAVSFSWNGEGLVLDYTPDVSKASSMVSASGVAAQSYEVAQVRNGAVRELNKAIAAHATLFDMDKEDVARLLFANRPNLSKVLPRVETDNFNPDDDGVIRVSLEDLNNYGG